MKICLLYFLGISNIYPLHLQHQYRPRVTKFLIDSSLIKHLTPSCERILWNYQLLLFKRQSNTGLIKIYIDYGSADKHTDIVSHFALLRYLTWYWKYFLINSADLVSIRDCRIAKGDGRGLDRYHTFW